MNFKTPLLISTLLLFSACTGVETESEIKPEDSEPTVEETAPEVTYEIRFHQQAEDGGYMPEKEWFIASGMQSDRTDALAEWDAALFKIEDDKETLLANSILDITEDVPENYAVIPYLEASGEQLIIRSVMPDSDNPFAILYSYDPEANIFSPFTKEVSTWGSVLSPEETMVAFFNGNGDKLDTLTIVDLANAKELKTIELKTDESFLSGDGMESIETIDIKWLDEKTLKYYTYNPAGKKSAEATTVDI